MTIGATSNTASTSSVFGGYNYDPKVTEEKPQTPQFSPFGIFDGYFAGGNVSNSHQG